MIETKEKECPYCKKKFVRIGEHIANAHPTVMKQIEELAEGFPTTSNTANIMKPLPSAVPQSSSISEMIKEKLDIMLNIKVIEMLGNNKDVDLQDIAKAINPPEKTSLAELKEYHDLVYSDKSELPTMGEETNWAEIAASALPIIKDMLPAKKQEMQENLKNVRNETDPSRVGGTLKPICLETAGSSSKSSSDSEKPTTTSNTDKSTNTSNKGTDTAV